MAPKNRKFAGSANTELKIAVIGDEDTVAGFLMAGVGQRDGQGKTNFLVVTSKTPRHDIEDAFRRFTQDRKDIGVILINQYVADEIRHMVDAHSETIPTVLEIPSKDRPYDAAKDSVMQRIKVFFGGEIPEA